MFKVLSALEQLQRIDLEISAIDGQEQGYKSEIERLATELEAVNEEVSTLTARLEEIEPSINDANERIRQSNDKIKKDEGKIGSVKNDRELSALNKEIRSAGKTKKQYEEELANLNARAGEIRARLEEANASALGKNTEMERLKSELEVKSAEWQGLIEEKQKLRDTVKVNIKPSILRKYELLRERRGGRGIVPVKNETCQGCYIHIPPQVYIELKRGAQELITCPHCHRILYFERQEQS